MFILKNAYAMKILLNSLAFICIALGTLGMFLPVLPTTPFLLLASWLFLKGNSAWRDWLINHPTLGPYIHNYIVYKAIPLKGKIISISTLWITILISAWIVNPIWLKILLIIIATGVTIHILSFKTLK